MEQSRSAPSSVAPAVVGRTPYRSPRRQPLVYRPRTPSATSSGTDGGAVATLLTPDERLRLQAAVLGRLRPVHRDSLEQLVAELRSGGCSAAVVSTDRLAACGRSAVARLADVVRTFPRVPVIALLGAPDPGVPQLLLALGRAGVRCLVDATRADGWQALRGVLGDDPLRQVGREALLRIEQEVSGMGDGCRRFFQLQFDVPPEPVTVGALAGRLGVRPTTMLSRFARAGLPSPKRYLALARLARAARLLENAGATLAGVSDHLEYSSPQSFGRHVRLFLGVSAAEFRRGFDSERMLSLYCDDVVRPYRERLARFTPLGRG